MSRLVVTVSGTGGPPGIAPAVTGVDANNNFTVSGQPTLLVTGAHFTPQFMTGYMKYTQAEYDAKLSQMTAAGFNALESGRFDVVSDEDTIWAGHTLAEAYTGGGGTTVPGLGATLAATQAFMAPALGKPWVLYWQPSGELDPTAYLPTPGVPQFISDFLAAVANFRAIDPAHPVCSSYAVDSGTLFANWDSLVTSSCIQLPFVELVPAIRTPENNSLGRLFSYTNLMNTKVLAAPQGLGWVPCVSDTWAPEMFPKFTACRIMTTAEISRYFWMQAAMNCRAFNVYNGVGINGGLGGNAGIQLTANSQVAVASSQAGDTRPVFLEGVLTDGVTIASETINLTGTTRALSINTYSKWKWAKIPLGQTTFYDVFLYQGAAGAQLVTMPNAGGGTGGNGQGCVVAPGDDGLPNGYLGMLNDTIAVIGKIYALRSLILAPTNWIQITAVTPSFSGSQGSQFTGIYAAKKSYGGSLYVIACNTNEDAGLNELAITGGTIDIGQTITTCVRIAGESGSPSFAGSTITDNFVAMGVHVYQVS